MGTPVNRGTSDPVLQKQTYQFDWRRGGTYTEEYKGISQAKMIQKYNGVVYLVSNAQLSLANSMAELRLEYSGDGSSGSTSSKALTIDRWEIPEPKTEKPLVSHPGIYDIFYFLGGLDNGLGATDAAVQNYTAQFQKGVAALALPNDQTDKTLSPPVVTPGWFTAANFPGWSELTSVPNYIPLAAYLTRQYNKCLNGQTHYQSSAYSVRHTTNTPSYWSANISDFNVNCIYTTAQMLSELTDPSLWNFPLPGRLQYKISAADAAFIQALTNTMLGSPSLNRYGYQVGWLKSPSAEASVGRNRVEIQGEFVLDQWSTDTYALAVT
jgi:hypothetical protein